MWTSTYFKSTDLKIIVFIQVPQEIIRMHSSFESSISAFYYTHPLGVTGETFFISMVIYLFQIYYVVEEDMNNTWNLFNG